MFAKAEAEKEARHEKQFWEQLQRLKGVGAGPPGDERPSPPLPPRSKQIPVKRARAFMREVWAALAPADVRARLRAARAKGAEAPVEEDAEEDEDDQDEGAAARGAMMMAVGPVLDAATRGVVLKYSFEGGFQQALESVAEAARRRGNEELRAGLQLVADLLAPPRPGRAPQLGPLAARFLAVPEADRRSSLEQAEKVLEAATAERDVLQVYVDAMKGVLDHGESHVASAVVEAVQSVRVLEEREQRKLTADERAAFDARVEVLMEFLGPLEQRDVEELVAARQPGHAEL